MILPKYRGVLESLKCRLIPRDTEKFCFIVVALQNVIDNSDENEFRNFEFVRFKRQNYNRFIINAWIENRTPIDQINGFLMLKGFIKRSSRSRSNYSHRVLRF